jgi:hypothetical protein
MKKKILSVMMLAFYTVAFAVTLSFGWMIQDTIDTVNYINADYSQNSENKLTISPTDIDIEVWGVSENGEYVKIENNQSLIINNVVPGEARTFRLRFRNRTQSLIRINLMLDNVGVTPNISDISENTPTGTLLDVLAISVRGGEGYINKPVSFPSVYKYLCIDSVYFTGTGKYIIPLFDALEIPPTGESDYVELNCYLMLDSEVGNEYQNKNIVIGTFRAEK